MTNKWQDILNDAEEEFKELIEDKDPQERLDYLEQDEPHDDIFEIADSNVPVYTGDLLELAADNYDLAFNEPEIGPAFDGSPTPINIIAANVFEGIEHHLWEWWNDNKDDMIEELEEQLNQETEDEA